IFFAVIAASPVRAPASKPTRRAWQRDPVNLRHIELQGRQPGARTVDRPCRKGPARRPRLEQRKKAGEITYSALVFCWCCVQAICTINLAQIGRASCRERV